MSFVQDLKEVNDVLKKVFLIFPQYCLGKGLMDLKVAYYMFRFTKSLLGKL